MLLIKKSHLNQFLPARLSHDTARRHYSISNQTLKTANNLTRNTGPASSLQNLSPRAKIRNRIKVRFESNWKEKILHDQFLRDMEVLNYDHRTSFAWLKIGEIKPETESLLLTAQEQVLKTRYIENRILHTREDKMCSRCK